MRQNLQRYVGVFTYKTDSKNRVNVVPDWRPAPGETVYLMKSFHEADDTTKTKIPILKFITEAGYSYRESVIIGKTENDPKAQGDMLTHLSRICTKSSVNDQGKILIPQHLSSYAGIHPESEVTMASGDSHFEIWNREKYLGVFGEEIVAPAENLYGIF